jgi:hypothetical protein
MKNGQPKHNRKRNGSPPEVSEGGQWDPQVYDIGLRAFERDLPELMKTHARQWVVYHGERRIGPAKRFQKLDRVCEKDGIPIGERVYRMIEPDHTFDVTF